MDYIILLALIVIAVCMALGRPLQINIHHKYDVPQPGDDARALDEAQKQFEEEQKETFDNVIQSIHEVLGVNVEDGYHNSKT